jgi:hypothetical protein
MQQPFYLSAPAQKLNYEIHSILEVTMKNTAGSVDLVDMLAGDN